MEAQKLIAIVLLFGTILTACSEKAEGGGSTPINDTVYTGNPIDSNKVSGPALNFQLTIHFPGVSNVGWAAVYVAWAEDSLGNNIQNIYICNSIVDDMTKNKNRLTGVALPYWSKTKTANTDLSHVDAITGASVQKPTTIKSNIAIEPSQSFRVCMEIDRSVNGNAYFTDRPSFIYKTGLLTMDSLPGNFNLRLMGFMANDTKDKKFGQTPPLQDIPGFEAWKYMENTEYLKPIDLLLNETEGQSNLSVTIEE
jgi:hypothetical protein